MRPVYIVGIGQTPVGEQWERSLRHIAHDAILPAMRDAGIERADALYVGNMLSGELVGQEHLGALIADFVGLRGIEAYKVEAACGSGGAALRTGFMAVAGGIHDVVIVAGVEKMTDTVGRDTTAALAMAADQEYEAAEGVSFVALNALLMRRYMYEYDIPHGAFGYFAMNAHQNGVSNPNAMFRQAITLEGYRRATMIADPINLMDSSPICDGAAAIVLASEPVAQALRNGLRPVRLAASAVATDSLAVHDRRDPTWLEAAWISSRKAYDQARIGPADVDLFELHDAFTIMGALSLEACGFAERARACVWPRKVRSRSRGVFPSQPWAASRRVVIRWVQRASIRPWRRRCSCAGSPAPIRCTGKGVHLAEEGEITIEGAYSHRNDGRT